MDAEPRWNHNIHYHPLVVSALPSPCARVLDVGCGEGALTLELAGHAAQVIGLDADAPIIEVARRDAAAENVAYVVGDLLTIDLEPASFDAVVSIATLHHLDTAAALERMRDLVRPGGVVAAVGLARSRPPVDTAYDVAGVVAARLHRVTKRYSEISAPTVWPPPLTYAETGQVAERVLPGVRYRRHVLFRYSLVWTKPVDP